MTLSELLTKRETDWRALEEQIAKRSRPLAKREPEDVAKFASLYRAVCGDLALAESYQFPPATIQYLNNLVGRANKCLYRRRNFSWRGLWETFFYDAPRWIVSDPTFWVAMILFWVPFLVCDYKCRYDVDFAEKVVGSGTLATMEAMYDRALDADPLDRVPAVGWYASHNGGIGFKCFALGAAGCLPGIFLLLSNSVMLGCVFGYMQSGAIKPETAQHFLEFTAAHGPFELTAIALSAAAGLRVGFGVIWTQGYRRVDSIRRAAIQATPTIVAAFALFCAAASIEALVSPNRLEYLTILFNVDSATIKSAIQLVASALLVFYFGVLGGGALVRNRFFVR
ncbi:MAG: stage II sporulation protein M [Thermoguttaceae bacterium]|nr:stage II sporulation protein M [Thermoguttaceae bacterium]